VTLVWFTPINPHHQGYRMIAIDVSAGSDDKFWLTPDRTLQPTDRAVARGTVFHERRTGESAAVFLDDGDLLLRLACRAPAGRFVGNVPFALAVSIEVGVEAGIPVYDQVRTRIQPAVPVAPQS